MRSMLLCVLIGAVALAGIVSPAGAQRRQPPTQQAPEGPDLGSFLACYDRQQRPTVAIVDILAAPRGQVTGEQQAFGERFGRAVRDQFSDRRIRVAAADRNAQFRDNAELDRLLGISATAAAGKIGEQLGCEVVFLLIMRPVRATADGGTEYDCEYEVIDVARNRSMGGNLWTMSSPGPRETAQRRRSELLKLSGFVAREMMKEYVAYHCGETPVAPLITTPSAPVQTPAPVTSVPRIEGPIEREFVGPFREVDLRVMGEFDDWETGHIVRGIRNLEYIETVLDGPFIRNDGEQKYVQMTISAAGTPFDLGDELAGGLFLATGKDSRLREADEQQMVLEVKNPTYSTWIGRESPRNRGARAALRRAYQRAGEPVLPVIIRQVTGKDFNEGTMVARNWYWFYPFRFDLWEDAGDNRAYSGEAVARSVASHLNNVGIDTLNAQRAFDAASDQDLAPEELQRSATLQRVLRDRYGTEMLAEGSGELSRRVDQVSVSYGFSVMDLASGRDLANTQTAARVVPFGDLAAGRFTNEVAEELAGQLIEALMQRWERGTDKLSIVMVDADTIRESDRVRSYLEENVDQVVYSNFRGLGSEGQVIEIAHRGAGDAIRTALTDGSMGVRFTLEEGTTSGRLRVSLAN